MVYNKYLEIVNSELKKYFDNLKECEGTLKESMWYSLSAGGKRIRPVLCLATADMLGVKRERIIPFALAIEFIHTYSLIHDDLPCMDNDDYRRGKPSNHKVYNEGIATLAGDALLNLAMEITSSCVTDKEGIEAMNILFRLSGYSGMIGGQALDLRNGDNEPTEKLFNEIIVKKTSMLLKAPLLIASALASKKYYDELNAFGEEYGKLFQITDDILDCTSTLEELGKTPSKDLEQNKLSAVCLYGLDGAKEIASKTKAKCIKILSDINGSEFFLWLVETTYNRKK